MEQNFKFNEKDLDTIKTLYNVLCYMESETSDLEDYFAKVNKTNYIRYDDLFNILERIINK